MSIGVKIPDNVLDAAKTAAYATEETGDDEAAITSFVGVRVICDAILAERKRCAKIAKIAADMEPGGALGSAGGPEYQAGCSDAGDWIYHEIMEPCK